MHTDEDGLEDTASPTTASGAAGAFPYRLRMEHEGLWSLRVERAGRRLRFDPRGAPEGTPLEDGDVVVLSWDWPELVDATAEALARGARIDVLAPPELVAWLADQGAPADRLHSDRVELDGMVLEQRAYTPIPPVTPDEAVHKVKSALRRPDRALLRLARKRGRPTCEPRVTQVTLPGGERLLHLALALHGQTPADWLDAAVSSFDGPEWLVCGADVGHQDAVRALLPRFHARRILVLDLLGEIRRSVGMPTELLTPLVDVLRTDGLDAYVFASKVSYRFEHEPGGG